MNSCATDKLIFQDKQFNDFENLNLKASIKGLVRVVVLANS